MEIHVAGMNREEYLPPNEFRASFCRCEPTAHIASVTAIQPLSLWRFSMEPRKALVIDDSSLIHRMFKLLLPRTLQVDAFDGREALDRLAGHPDIDLILLDINMPNMNGFEFLERIKMDRVFSSIPVIIVSTEGRDEDTIRGLQAGAAAYVRKPFRNEAVAELIRQVMNGAPARLPPDA